MDLHVLPIPIPPPSSLSTRSLWVFPVHQVWALVSCIQHGLVICYSILTHMFGFLKDGNDNPICNWVLFQLLSLVSTRGKFAPKRTVMWFMRKICFWSFKFIRFLTHSFQTPWNWVWQRCLFNFGCSGLLCSMTVFFVISETYSLVVVRGLPNAVSSLPVELERQSLWASIVAASGLGCPVACGIFLNQGWSPHPLH